MKSGGDLSALTGVETDARLTSGLSFVAAGGFSEIDLRTPLFVREIRSIPSTRHTIKPQTYLTQLLPGRFNGICYGVEGWALGGNGCDIIEEISVVNSETTWLALAGRCLADFASK